MPNFKLPRLSMSDFLRLQLISSRLTKTEHWYHRPEKGWKHIQTQLPGIHRIITTAHFLFVITALLSCVTYSCITAFCIMIQIWRAVISGPIAIFVLCWQLIRNHNKYLRAILLHISCLFIHITLFAICILSACTQLDVNYISSISFSN